MIRARKPRRPIADEPIQRRRSAEPRRGRNRRREPEVNKLFRMVMKHEASDLHLKVGQPPMMRLRGDIRQMDMRPLTQEDMERLLLPHPERQAPQDPRRRRRRRLLLRRRQRRVPLPRQPVQAARPAVAGRPARQQHHPELREPGPARRHREAVQVHRRAGHPGRRDRLGQEHDHRLHARLHQRPRAAAHPHHRGPDRVHLHRQEGVHQPARDRPGRDATGTRRSRTRCAQDPDVILVGELRDVETFEAAVHAAETGPPGVRHHPRLERRDDDQPHPRPVPAGQARRHPAGAGEQPQGGRRPEAASRASRSARVPTNEIMIVNPTIRKLIVGGRGQQAARRDPHRATRKA